MRAKNRKEAPMNRIIAVAAAALAACAGPRVAAAPDLSQAEGVVKFGRLSDDRVSIDLAVRRLEEPEKLSPPGHAYVAWVRRGPDHPAQNVGALNVDEQLNGELRTATDLRRFELFVTAEAASDVDKPAGPPLLWTSHD
jgi:hypothetical protein